MAGGRGLQPTRLIGSLTMPGHGQHRFQDQVKRRMSLYLSNGPSHGTQAAHSGGIERPSNQPTCTTAYLYYSTCCKAQFVQVWPQVTEEFTLIKMIANEGNTHLDQACSMKDDKRNINFDQMRSERHKLWSNLISDLIILIKCGQRCILFDQMCVHRYSLGSKLMWSRKHNLFKYDYRKHSLQSNVTVEILFYLM